MTREEYLKNQVKLKKEQKNDKKKSDDSTIREAIEHTDFWITKSTSNSIVFNYPLSDSSRWRLRQRLIDELSAKYDFLEFKFVKEDHYPLPDWRLVWELKDDNKQGENK